ncbi:hypothetical protein N2152v2_006875 [Parachlorella kessleri]
MGFCRSKSRVENAVSSIIKATGNDKVQGYTADLGSLAAIRQLAEELRQQHPRISTLINNAGVFETQKRVSQDGFEMTWAVNVLAPFLLTGLLLDTITDRVVNVSSISAAGQIDFNNLQQERGFSSHNSYSLSKLCSMLFTYELARRLKAAGSSVTANCLDPGTVNTKMLTAGWGPCGIEIEEADDEFSLATDPSVAGVSGAYFVSQQKRRSPQVSYDTSVQQRLWSILEEQAGMRYSV